MLFGLLGDIRIGDGVWTGPTADSIASKAALVQHKVARGKPVVQDMGDDLDTKTLKFFFDETFCTPLLELAKLEAARAARLPLPLVIGSGGYDGMRFRIEEFSKDILKTTPYGTPTRIEISAKLLEFPVPSPLTLLSSIARDSAAALSTNATTNPDTRK